MGNGLRHLLSELMFFSKVFTLFILTFFFVGFTLCINFEMYVFVTVCACVRCLSVHMFHLKFAI